MHFRMVKVKLIKLNQIKDRRRMVSIKIICFNQVQNKLRQKKNNIKSFKTDAAVA